LEYLINLPTHTNFNQNRAEVTENLSGALCNFVVDFVTEKVRLL
jgi:hypothetical protein